VQAYTPLGVQIMLVERSRDALGVQAYTPLGVQIMLVERSRDALGVQIMLVERSRDALGVHNLTNSYLSLTTQNPPKNRQCRLLR
jgi:hypothetical protein